jgi:hypothetical protein
MVVESIVEESNSWNQSLCLLTISTTEYYFFDPIFRQSDLVLKNALIMVFKSTQCNTKFSDPDPTTSNQTWKLIAAEICNADDKLSYSMILYHTRLLLDIVTLKEQV